MKQLPKANKASNREYRTLYDNGEEREKGSPAKIGSTVETIHQKFFEENGDIQYDWKSVQLYTEEKSNASNQLVSEFLFRQFSYEQIERLKTIFQLP